MLIIRKEQMETLAGQKRYAAAAEILPRLARAYPGPSREIGAAGLEKLVHEGVATGLRCGVDDVEALTRLVGLMLQFGPRFENSPDAERALAVLDHPRLPGRIKVAELADILDSRAGGRVVLPPD